MKATAWFNGQSYHTPPLSLNLIHNALLAHYTGDADFRLTVTNHPLPFTEFDKLNQGSSGSLVGFQVGFNLAFGMAFLSASFVIFLGISIAFDLFIATRYDCYPSTND